VIRRLITLGAVITGLGGALAAWLLLHWEPRLALLFGSLVVVTGPTVVGPLVRELRLRPSVGSVLRAEGVLTDPIGALPGRAPARRGVPTRATAHGARLEAGRAPRQKPTGKRASGRTRGRAMPVKDSLIAATALVHDLTVVAHSRTDFEQAGVRIQDPLAP
jgi:hypothetical protein